MMVIRSVVIREKPASKGPRIRSSSVAGGSLGDLPFSPHITIDWAQNE